MAQSSAARCGGVRGGGSMLPNEALWVSESGLAVPNVEVELTLNEPFLKMAASGEFGDRPRSSATLTSKSKLYFFTFNFFYLTK